MRKGVVILMMSFFIHQISTPQSLLLTNYTFTTQSQIDSFPILHPGQTIINGCVSISGPNISNLMGFSGITSILGSPYSSSGALSIHDNPSLHNLQGLNSLMLVGTGGVYITDNPVIEDLYGLNSLKDLNCQLSIKRNASLVSLSGLDSLEEIQYFLDLKENPLLQNVDGLHSLWAIGTTVNIENNPSLKDLNGLSALQFVYGYFMISSNDSLNSIDGIANVEGEGIIELDIVGNHLLSSCAVQSVCNYLASHGNSSYLIYDNAPGCNNATEVLQECTEIGQNEKENKINWMVTPNPADDFITVSANGYHAVSTIELYSLYGQRWLAATLPAGTSEQRFDVATLSSGIYILRIKSEQTPDYLVKVLVR